MSTLKYNITGEGDKGSVLVTIPGDRPLTAERSHPNYKTIIDFLHADNTLTTEDEKKTIRELFDISFVIGQRFETLTDRLTTSGGRIFLDGDEINTALTDAILKFQKQGVSDWKPLALFLEKMLNNPNQEAVKHLYQWLQNGQWQVCDDGDFIGYKGVGPEWKSGQSGEAIVDGVWVKGHIPYKPGSVVEMPRSMVDFNPGVACSVGLHVGTHDFARSYASNGHMVTLKINPINVVSVPYNGHDTHAGKIRVCKCVVVEEVDRQGQSIVHTAPAKPAPSYTNDDPFISYTKKDFENLPLRSKTGASLLGIAKTWKVGTTRTPREDLVKILTKTAKKKLSEKK